MSRSKEHNSAFVISRNELTSLLGQLQVEGYRVIGPQVEQGCIRYRTLEDATQLPWGYRDQQQPGRYHIESMGSDRAFAWANGPEALKPLFFSPQERLWQVEKSGDGLAFRESLPESERLAIIGVRACDLAALNVHDQHFLHGVEPDSHYARRRENVLLIAVNCSHPAATCFCAATGDGPNASGGYDLLLDELNEGYVVTPGSAAGNTLLQTLPLGAVLATQQQQLDKQRVDAAKQQRTLPQQNLSKQLSPIAESARWQQVADRCLACGNCTAVCPTCFCHSEHDVPQLDGRGSEHLRQWDSCFSADHSMLHGIAVRAETVHRYRQWLTHKFDHWHQQYGRSGCVGCGRCITWCPVGIDITEELGTLCGGEV